MQVRLRNTPPLAIKHCVSCLDAIAGHTDYALHILYPGLVGPLEDNDLPVGRAVMLVPPGVRHKEFIPLDRRRHGFCRSSKRLIAKELSAMGNECGAKREHSQGPNSVDPPSVIDLFWGVTLPHGNNDRMN